MRLWRAFRRTIGSRERLERTQPESSFLSVKMRERIRGHCPLPADCCLTLVIQWGIIKKINILQGRAQIPTGGKLCECSKPTSHLWLIRCDSEADSYSLDVRRTKC